MRSLLCASLLLATAAQADIPPPLLSVSGCQAYDFDCTRCTWDYRERGSPAADDRCVVTAQAQGRELACSKRSGAMGIGYYCPPGLTKAIVSSSGMHWIFAWAGGLLGLSAGLIWWRRRRTGRTPTA